MSTRTHDHDHEPDPLSREFWDDRYGATDRLWSGDPNPHLVTETAGLTPGDALEVGCGEGADALWLARSGWRVTAVDISEVALARGAAHTPPELADRVRWQPADLLTWRPPAATYDLVNAQFVLHFPRERHAVRDRLRADLAAAVRPGGTLLIVGHDFSDVDTAMPRPHDPDLFQTVDQLAAGLDPDRWIVHTRATPSRPGRTPDGEPVVLHDAVLRAERRR